MNTQDAKAAAERARYDIADTLDAIEDKLNVPKRAAEMGRRAKASYDLNPIPWIIGGGAVLIPSPRPIARAGPPDDDPPPMGATRPRLPPRPAAPTGAGPPPPAPRARGGGAAGGPPPP